jgi:hypothetical protein
MLYTRYKNKNENKEIKAVFWNGDYLLYRQLVNEEPNFVAVLDDGGKKGEDKIKLWNENIKNWEACPKGNYIIKEENIFTVKTREQMLSEWKPIR